MDGAGHVGHVVDGFVDTVGIVKLGGGEDHGTHAGAAGVEVSDVVFPGDEPVGGRGGRGEPAIGFAFGDKERGAVAGFLLNQRAHATGVIPENGAGEDNESAAEGCSDDFIPAGFSEAQGAQDHLEDVLHFGPEAGDEEWEEGQQEAVSGVGVVPEKN